MDLSLSVVPERISELSTRRLPNLTFSIFDIQLSFGNNDQFNAPQTVVLELISHFFLIFEIVNRIDII